MPILIDDALMLKPFDTGVCQYDETAAGKVRRSVRGSHFGPWHRKYEDNSDESRTDDGRRQPFARWRDAALVWSTTERPHGWTRSLINLAYRFLGPSAEAEDAVQEADAHWYGLSRSQQAAVVSPDAWLNTVTTRVCLEVLRPARARRERYVGEWLP